MKKQFRLAESGSKKNPHTTFLGFVQENRWFAFSVVIVLAAVLVLLYSSVQQSYSEEKASYARQMYSDNGSTIDDYASAIDAQIAQPQSSQLETAYLASIKDDLAWLKNKQDEVYNSKPNTDVLAKESAFYLFTQKILQINQDFTFDVGTPDYSGEINSALSADINYPKLINDQQLNDLLDSQNDRDIFTKEVRSLFDDYISAKKSLLESNLPIERKYAEAKKITWVSYGD